MLLIVVAQGGARRQLGFDSLEDLKMEEGGEEEELKILGNKREEMMSKTVLILSFLFDL